MTTSITAERTQWAAPRPVALIGLTNLGGSLHHEIAEGVADLVWHPPRAAMACFWPG